MPSDLCGWIIPFNVKRRLARARAAAFPCRPFAPRGGVRPCGLTELRLGPLSEVNTILVACYQADFLSRAIQIGEISFHLHHAVMRKLRAEATAYLAFGWLSSDDGFRRGAVMEEETSSSYHLDEEELSICIFRRVDQVFIYFGVMSVMASCSPAARRARRVIFAEQQFFTGYSEQAGSGIPG